MPVNEPPADAALEEAAAAVAGVDAVVFAAAGVTAHFAHQGRTHGFPRRRALGCGFKQSAEGGVGGSRVWGVTRLARVVHVALVGIVSHACLPSVWSMAGQTFYVVTDLF